VDKAMPIELLTVQEVCQIFKCTPATLRKWDRKGLLKVVRTGKGRVLRYRKADVDKFAGNTKHSKFYIQKKLVFPQFTDANPDPILITDTSGRIFYVNPAWIKLTGYTEEEVKGENPRFLQSGKTPLKVYKSLWKYLSKGQTYTTREIVNRKKNGEEFHVHATHFPIMKHGKPVFYVQMLHDISRIIEVEKQKDAFISIASHELKTPITTLFTYSQILEKRMSRRSGQQDAHILSSIILQTKRLVYLVDDLLNVSRLESGKLAFRPEEFDINSLVEHVVADFQYTSEKHKIIKVGEIKNNAIGDKNRIEQVIINLLSNAIKYSPNADKVIVGLMQEKKRGIISVQDFGFGIAKKDQQNIFKRFYRTKDKDEGKVTGFGLGLYICSEIVKKHKGKIWVDSTRGKGSTFSFSFPLVSNK
jgi:PAS domain S-box-containing protein/excisionase family DNA binding protein